MIDLGFYERVISIKDQKKNKTKKIGIFIACAVALLIWLIVAIVAGAAAVACVIVSVFIAAVPFAVSNLSATELEISLSPDHISLSMIYGGRRRKEVFYAEPDDMLLIAPNTKDNLAKAEALTIKERFTALSGNCNEQSAENLKQWLAVFKDGKDNNYLFIFEAEDGAQKLLKSLAPSVMSYR